MHFWVAEVFLVAIVANLYVRPRRVRSAESPGRIEKTSEEQLPIR